MMPNSISFKCAINSKNLEGKEKILIGLQIVGFILKSGTLDAVVWNLERKKIITTPSRISKLIIFDFVGIHAKKFRKKRNKLTLM